jgi:NAD(P)-dependent dehydrogenase (short-subunit alcohol dehydrogenase family)
MSTAGTAWVTGASGYWGRKVTMSLLRRNWEVIALSRGRPDDLLAWAESQGRKLTWQAFDFEDLGWPKLLEALPAPTAFFHCSGLYDDNFDRMLNVNVSQPVRLVETVIARMKAQNAGRIGILLGQNGRIGMPGLGAFSATQGALWTWAEAAARGLGKEERPVSLTLVFPARAPSTLQGQLARKLDKKVKLKPPATADKLVDGVLKGKKRAGRRPLAAGLLTFFT